MCIYISIHIHIHLKASRASPQGIFRVSTTPTTIFTFVSVICVRACCACDVYVCYVYVCMSFVCLCLYVLCLSCVCVCAVCVCACRVRAVCVCARLCVIMCERVSVCMCVCPVPCAYVRVHILMYVYVGGQVGLTDAKSRSQTASTTSCHHDCSHGRCHTGTNFLRLSFVPALCGVEKRAKQNFVFSVGVALRELAQQRKGPSENRQKICSKTHFFEEISKKSVPKR